MGILVLLMKLCLICSTVAVPVARLLGCGTGEPQFPLEKHQFCCLHFKLNCNNFDSIEHLSSPQDGFTRSLPNVSTNAMRGRRGYGNPKGERNLIRVRSLGESCHFSNVRCAVGLECRRGLCLRTRSLAHLQRLIKAGEKIEREEQAQQADVHGTLSGSGLTVGVGITLDGQSIVSENDGENKVSETGGSTSHGSIKQTDLLEQDKAASGIEEDEVTANVADFLQSKGMKLGDKDWHSVRELIAGTIDERLERDDEIQKADDAIETFYRSGCSDKSKPCILPKRAPTIDLCPAMP